MVAFSPLLQVGFVLLLIVTLGAHAHAQENGSIRGTVTDQDFDQSLGLVEVSIIETQQTVATTAEGNYVFPEVEPGTYTMVFNKSGYTRRLRGDVLVQSGEVTEVNVDLAGEFTEMEEFIVEELKLGGATELGLLRLRLESPALLDSISSEFMSKAGASDAASALKLVSGASVQEGKYAVVRGLPDRYVNSQLNGVRMPTSDAEKRAVQLDQFPSSVIESIQVAKTFTPDQQGDASGGAVDIILKGIPDQSFISLKSEYTWNSNTSGRSDFLSYQGAGFNFWGDPTRPVGPFPAGTVWPGPVGVSTTNAPIDYKWEFATGGRLELEEGVTVGGMMSFVNKHESQLIDDGIQDGWGVRKSPIAGQPAVNPQWEPLPWQKDGTDFYTELYDWEQGTRTMQWGTMLSGGFDSELFSFSATYLSTKIDEDQATQLDNTRGKEFFFPGYDPSDPVANWDAVQNGDANISPWTRLQTIGYTQRTTETRIFTGRNVIPLGETEAFFSKDDQFVFLNPTIDWQFSTSEARFYQPDKTQFAATWQPGYTRPLGNPANPAAWIAVGSSWTGLPPVPNINFGYIQRIYKEITEKSSQAEGELTLPFLIDQEREGEFKIGIFDDKVTRNYSQQTFQVNAGATVPVGQWTVAPNTYPGTGAGSAPPQDAVDWADSGPSYEDNWADVWPGIPPGGGLNDAVMVDPGIDVDYTGEQRVKAFYGMMDLPLSSTVNLIGGARVETTRLRTTVIPEANVQWVPDPLNQTQGLVNLNPGDADVDYVQSRILPSVALQYDNGEDLIFRLAYNETIARQTFREITPVIQQEYAGGPIFVGNADLVESTLQNFDARLDITPYEGGLISLSGFYKYMVDPIENISLQVVGLGSVTTPVNYPDGHLYGFEFECRQDLGVLFGLEGLTIGGNFTKINSQVTLSDVERDNLALAGYPATTRQMTGAPDYLVNAFLNFSLEQTGTNFSIFYTLKGQTLQSGGAAAAGRQFYTPSIYEAPIDTLNVTISQEILGPLTLDLKFRNLTNPEFRTFYQDPNISGTRTYTSYTRGIDVSVGLNLSFDF